MNFYTNNYICFPFILTFPYLFPTFVASAYYQFSMKLLNLSLQIQSASTFDPPLHPCWTFLVLFASFIASVCFVTGWEEDVDLYSHIYIRNLIFLIHTPCDQLSRQWVGNVSSYPWKMRDCFYQKQDYKVDFNYLWYAFLINHYIWEPFL